MKQQRKQLLVNSGAAAVVLYTISGTVYTTDGTTPVASATVTLGALSATSAANGTYTISNVPAGTSGSMTCAKAGYNWDAITISAMSGNLTGKDYTANYNLLNELIDYWKMNAASGNEPDSVGGRTMAETGTGTIGSTTGKIGNCRTAAGGETRYLQTAQDATLNDVDWAGGFSVCGWVYIATAATAAFNVLGKYSSGTVSEWYLQVGVTGNLAFNVNDSVSGASTATIVGGVTVDGWHFCAGRYNSSSKKAEVSMDGSAWTVATNALSNEPLDAQQYLRMIRTTTAYGKCQLDEIGLWSRYLSDEEVTALYNGGTGQTYPF